MQPWKKEEGKKKNPKTEQKNPIIHQKDHVKRIEQAEEKEGKKKGGGGEPTLLNSLACLSGGPGELAYVRTSLLNPLPFHHAATCMEKVLVKPEWNYRETSEARKTSRLAVYSARIRHCGCDESHRGDTDCFGMYTSSRVGAVFTLYARSSSESMLAESGVWKQTK